MIDKESQVDKNGKKKETEKRDYGAERERETERERERETDRQTDRQTNRQTDRCLLDGYKMERKPKEIRHP